MRPAYCRATYQRASSAPCIARHMMPYMPCRCTHVHFAAVVICAQDKHAQAALHVHQQLLTGRADAGGLRSPTCRPSSQPTRTPLQSLHFCALWMYDPTLLAAETGVGLEAASRKLREAVEAAVALPQEAQDQVAEAMQGVLQQLLLASRCGELPPNTCWGRSLTSIGGMVLSCAVLCCAVLCCAVLCCAVLCCAVLCCAVLRAMLVLVLVLLGELCCSECCAAAMGDVVLCRAGGAALCIAVLWHAVPNRAVPC
jgi:hypothetical protein